VLADVDERKLENTVEWFKEPGAAVLGVTTDVSRPEQVEALAQKGRDAFGAVHVVCNNAGVAYGGRSSWETPVEAWNWVLGVNLMGVIHGLHAFMPILLEQDTEAHVVNTASVAGLVRNSTNASYGVSKHAVVSLSESLHAELQTRGAKVKVSVLCPGPVNTDIMNSSERNRPGTVPPPPELTQEEALLRRAFGMWLERGMEPKDVGRQVLDAIREERFYVITHDYDAFIEDRMKDILGKENPGIREPPQDLLEIFQELVSQSSGSD
jgi:NAD(P)-dependent dehydrogenase (short-subunit alcohol dehydrogenase family)